MAQIEVLTDSARRDSKLKHNEDSRRLLAEHVTDRLVRYATFASRSFHPVTQKTYMEHMSRAGEALHLAQEECQPMAATIAGVMRIISDSMPKLSPQDYSWRDRLRNVDNMEAEGRRQALSDALDLTLSVQRFFGIPPFSHRDEYHRDLKSRYEND